MTEIYAMPGNLIRRMYQISVSVFEKAMKQNGIDLTPVQFATLATLRDNAGIDQATVAGMVAYDRPTIGSVIDRLETRGLLRREVNPNDRRARLVWITDEGKTLLSQAFPVVRAMQSDMLTGLSDDEKATFITLAAKLAEAGNDLSRAPLVLP